MFNEKQLEYITDTACKYGCLLGWSIEFNCYKCINCEKIKPLEAGEHKPELISYI